MRQKGISKKGFGKELLDVMLERAFVSDVNVLYGECSPVSSLSYWKKHGFTQVSGGQNIKVQRILERPLDIPPGLPEVLVEVLVYPSGRDWDDTVSHLFVKYVKGARLDDGTTKLQNRIIIPHKKDHQSGDVVLKLIVGGEQLFCDKAKRQKRKW